MEVMACKVDLREHELLSTLITLQDERDKAIQRFHDEAQRRAVRSKFTDTLLKDMDEMGKALDISRQTARRRKLLLAEKDAEVERLTIDKRDLLNLMIQAEPRQLWKRVKKEIAEQGLAPSEDFEKRWLAWIASTEDVTPTGSKPVVGEEASHSVKHNTGKSDKDRVVSVHHHLDCDQRNDWTQGLDGAEKSSLLRILFMLVLEEGTVNFQYVLKKGLFFLPVAVFCFWMRFSVRLTWLLAGGHSISVGAVSTYRAPVDMRL